jgi:hypothetical protein
MRMSTPTPADDLAARLRIAQIIWGAILAGAVAFLVIAVALRRPPVEDVPTSALTWAALGIAAVIAVGYHFAVNAVETGQRQKLAQSSTGTAAWYGAYQTSLIVSLACLEAGAFLMLVIYLTEPRWVTLLAAIAFIGIMASYFPNRPGVERWIKEQQDRLRQERSGG